MSLFSLVSVLITLAAVSSYFNYRYIKLPTTIGVMLVALLGSLALILISPYNDGLRDEATALVARIDFDQVVLHGLLAFLLFAAAIHVKFDHLRREWLPIGLLAVVGTLMSTFIVGTLAWWILGWMGLGIPFMHALLFGALISPTDPIAVVAIMKSVGVSQQLESQISGESLFNDGLGVVVFMVLLQLAGLDGAQQGSHLGSPIDAAAVGFLLLKEVGGALLLACAVGYTTHQMLKRVDNYQVEVLITLALAMGLYALADGLHLSAPIAVVIAGLFVGNHGRQFAMSDETRENVDTFWELIDEILNVVLFFLIGLELLILPIERAWLLAGALMIPVVVGARGFCVSLIMGTLKRVREQSPGTIRILTWGGLRGGISVAMALSLPEGDLRNLVLTLTYCVVVFSIVVQGLSMGKVIRWSSRG
ncbi:MULTISPECIES: cation:proton antiporter [unclassified Halomonas]|uniref:cation:proton antiporter n=1 Tax=unclassified Halomonas TaxID=2609666 RepID=UPI0021E4BD40|nr:MULTISPECIES: sodium:proton antiporter [unclassified Halomonas]UYG00282.1 sodium:proton antiporter [Halomonas sp. GD1P12]WNL38639.1 sodium:proton antiporter [Halomonas sp. PAMB 3232]